MLLPEVARDDCAAIDAGKYALLDECCTDREAIFTREALPKDAAKELLCLHRHVQQLGRHVLPRVLQRQGRLLWAHLELVDVSDELLYRNKKRR